MTIREVDVSLCRSVPAAVIRSGVQRVFVNRLNRARKNVRRVVVISPWISTTFAPSCPFITLVGLIRERRIPSYFITRRPENAQQSRAVDILRSCPTVELIHNDNVHAKLYVCTGPSPHGFALIGSANLTTNSLNLYEIGLLVVGVGPGSYIVEELGSFGTQHLRTRPESEVIKKIDVRSLRNVL
jgi:hypothetical protein